MNLKERNCYLWNDIIEFYPWLSIQNLNMVAIAIIVVLAILILVIFIIIRNRKDKKELLSPGPDENPVEEEKTDIQRREEGL